MPALDWVSMPGSGKKKKKRSGSQALGAEDTGSAKESEETSFGDNDEEDLMSPKVFLNDKINVFQQKYPRTLGEISTLFNDEDNIMVMISTYEDYEDKAEFDELLSLNVDIVRNMIANGRFSKAAFQQVYRALPWQKNLTMQREPVWILRRLPLWTRISQGRPKLLFARSSRT